MREKNNIIFIKSIASDNFKNSFEIKKNITFVQMRDNFFIILSDNNENQFSLVISMSFELECHR